MSGDPNVDSRTRLTRLWLESEPAIRAFVFAAVRGLQDAEDVAQQVALTAAKRFDEYDASRPFVAWALWLARSRVVAHYRKQARQREVFSDALLGRLAAAIEQRSHAESSARQLALEECLERLPQKSRAMLDLRYVDNLPMESIAQKSGVTPGSARVMLCRIRDRLASCVESRLKLEAGGQ
jgi:RNA polymerase sigma-70 factor (ECF subfamily)